MKLVDLDHRVMALLQSVEIRDLGELRQLLDVSLPRLRSSIQRLRDDRLIEPDALKPTLKGAGGVLCLREATAEDVARVAAEAVAEPAAGWGNDQGSAPVSFVEAPPSGVQTFGRPWRERAAALIGNDARDRVELAARGAGVPPWQMLRKVIDRGLAGVPLAGRSVL